MDALRLKDVERVCQLALDCDESSRDRVIEEACGGDAALRAEVEALLAHAATSERFLEEPAAEAAALVLAGRDKEIAGPDWAGRRLSHYSVVERIGSGGMGVVFRARDERLGRDVAIKALPENFAADPERVARLGREAHILASLSHPNIGAVHGLEDVDGARFLVLEFVEGDALDQRLAGGALSLEESLAIGRQIAAGVGAAHERGIVHRDLKPSNIKIADDERSRSSTSASRRRHSARRPPAAPSPGPTCRRTRE
jgi:eukaryotic-like serine/threonine-protein kinase